MVGKFFGRKTNIRTNVATFIKLRGVVGIVEKSEGKLTLVKVGNFCNLSFFGYVSQVKYCYGFLE